MQDASCGFVQQYAAASDEAMLLMPLFLGVRHSPRKQNATGPIVTD